MLNLTRNTHQANAGVGENGLVEQFRWYKHAIDLLFGKNAGYAFSDWIDKQLPLSVWEMAYRRRKPYTDLIFHSDRGVQYAARAYQEWLEE